MAKVDISKLGNKIEDGGLTKEGQVSATEWNQLVHAVETEQDETIRGVRLNGQLLSKDINNIVDVVTQTDGTTFSARLTLDLDENKPIVTIADTYKVRYRFSAIQTADMVRSNANVRGTIQIRRTSVGEDDVIVGTINNVISRGENATDTWDELNLAPYLREGVEQTINLSASFTPRQEGTSKVSSLSHQLIITKTSLSLTYESDATQPMSIANNSIHVDYSLTGVVERILWVKITGSKGDYTYKEVIAANAYTNNLSTKGIDISIDNDTAGILTHGVKTIEAWLTCSDGTTANALESEHVVSQRMVVLDDKDTEPHLLIQNLKTNVTNYVATNICSYVLFAADEKVVTFRLTDYGNNEEYYTSEVSVAPNKLYYIDATVEIENTSDDTLYAYLHAETKDKKPLIEPQRIKVDNTEKFAPTLGADFFLNPKTRNNSESDPFRIINAATGEEVASTFSGFSAKSDLWVQDENQPRVLRVLAGQSVTFEYDWLKAFATNNNANVTLEFDYKVSNVTDEDGAIIDASEADGDSFLGMILKPLELITYAHKEKSYQERNVMLQEDSRIHIAINIVSALRATTDASARALPICRVFVNGVINREFLFDNTINDWHIGGKSFKIGHPHADIDIYGIRCYTSASTHGRTNYLSASDILNDYTSSLPTAAEKVVFREANTILNPASNLIDSNLCLTKGKNVLIWHGAKIGHPKMGFPETANGWWEIHIFKADGSEDLEHSGTLCKETASLAVTRQGTTANTYAESNNQTKLKDVTATIIVKHDGLHQDIKVGDMVDIASVDAKKVVTKAENTKYVVPMYGNGLGKNDWSSEAKIKQGGAQYYAVTEDGSYIVPDGWVNGYGQYCGKCWSIADGIYSIKPVNKINYASGMQSHLLGANRAYNDLHKDIVTLNPFKRVSKYQLPFLYFTQELNSDVAVFNGPSTFGPGKMDDACIGFDKKQHPYFCMLEGADNNRTLTDFQTPWESKYIEYSFVDKGKEKGDAQGFSYDGIVSFDLDKYVSAADKVVFGGKEKEVPNEFVLNKIKEFVNFLYNHSTMIKVFVGKWSGTEGFLQQSDDLDKEHRYKWWCTEGDEKFKLKRYNPAAKEWQDAGWNEASEEAEVLRLDDKYSTLFSQLSGSWDKLNEAIKNAIASDADKTMGSIIDKESLQLHYAYINTFEAGTDNCSKNTYYALVPAGGDKWIWQLWVDDSDTIKPTDNSGFQNKPYYIDRQHPCADDAPTTSLYQGDGNVLFSLCETAYEDNGQNKLMMRRMFTSMNRLSGNPWKFQDDYFFAIQRYFPAVAFNEAARIRYEIPSVAGFISDRGVDPISQSCGDQLQCEMQFMKKRIVLYASYCYWGDFDADSTSTVGLADTVDTLRIQGTAGKTHKVAFKGLVPHQYMYITGRDGTTKKEYGKRCKPGIAVDWEMAEVVGDTVCALCGVNYFRSIGNIGDLSITNQYAFTLTGKRLMDVTIEPTGETDFVPSTFRLDTPLIEKISLHGSKAITGSLDLSKCIRLKSIDLRDTAITEVLLPQSKALTSIKYPASLTNLSLVDLENLEEFEIQGYENLKNVEVENTNTTDIYSLLSLLYTFHANKQDSPLKNISIHDVNWSNVKLSVLTFLADRNGELSGTIALADSLNYEDKLTLAHAFGDIDTGTDGLKVEYKKVAMSGMLLSGEELVNVGTHQYHVSFKSGNDFKIANHDISVRYELSKGAALFGSINRRGEMTVRNIDDSTTTYTLRATVDRLGGYADESELDIIFTNKQYRLRVEMDGSFEGTISVDGKDVQIASGQKSYDYIKDTDFAYSLDNAAQSIVKVLDAPHVELVDRWVNLTYYRCVHSRMNVGTGQYFFRNCGKLRKIVGTERWDASSLTNLAPAFENLKVDRLDLSNWDISNVTYMDGICTGATINTLVLTGWKFDSVSVLHRYYKPFGPNVTNVVGPISGINISFSLYSGGQTRESLLVFINGLADRTGQSALTFTIGSALKNILTDEDIKIATDKNWTIA